MSFPETKMRRLRSSESMIELVSEVRLHPSDFVLPLFFDERISSMKTTASMPGVPSYPLSGYDAIASGISESGVKNVLLFGVPSEKDPLGSGSHSKQGVVQKAIRGLKENSDILVIADLCMCEYTDHGHCGIIDDGIVNNDKTLEIYAKIAVSQAEAGADIIAPSGMMDGQVRKIRNALDDAGHKNVAIMAYSAKFKSSFYGPFRDIACSSPSVGNRSGYQIQPANRREAMREMKLDLKEGADILMVKPAMAYLDVIHEARSKFDVPIAAYQVSGEYSMIKAAGEKGWIDAEEAMVESLLSIKRAGADILITYFAEEMAEKLKVRG